LRDVVSHKREGGFASPALSPSPISPVMVPLLLDSGRTVRANISLDAALLEAIDAAAKERGLSRSAFLASAARDKIMTGA
jgi:HicB_like antitoxin of bacterial toxin-antitoxin system